MGAQAMAGGKENMTTAGCGVVEDNGRWVSLIPDLHGPWIEFKDKDGKLQHRVPQNAKVMHRHDTPSAAMFWVGSWIARN